MRNGNNFNWSQDRWQLINKVAHDESAKIRVARQALPLFCHKPLPYGDSGGFVDSVVGHQVTLGPLLQIKAGQVLVPVELAREFQLSPEQFHDEQVAEALAIRAAYDLALAEDAVVLQGKNARGFLTSLNVVERNLDEQGGGLFDGNQQQVQQPILESILEGIATLRTRNQHGPYCVIVSPDLYQEAFAPRQNTLNAPIYEIRPLLEGGFFYSPAALEKTGVIFSLGGHTLGIAVPVDVMVELTDEEKGVALMRVVEQFRFLENDLEASEPLK